MDGKERHRTLHVAASWASNINPAVIVPPATLLTGLQATSGGFILNHEHEAAIGTFKVEGWERGMGIYANPNLSIDIAVDESPVPCDDIGTLGFRFKAMTHAVDVSYQQPR